MRDLEQLSEYLASLPGLGPRQARRIAYFLITEKTNLSGKLVKTLAEARQNRRYCVFCQALFFDQGEHCRTCRDQSRDRSVLMLVENDIDKESIEKTGAYKGMYFIIGGSAPVTESDLSATKLRLAKMEEILKRSDRLPEIILGFNYTPQGEHTAELLSRYLKKQFSDSIKISHLGRGLSTGTELEYSDADTFRHALDNRK